MKKSTATVTWVTYRNIGTCLQAYALQRAIKDLGFDNMVIDDASVIASFPRKRFSPLRLLRSIPFLAPSRSAFKKCRRQTEYELEDFKRKYMSIDSGWKSREDLSSRYEVFVAGSDQIWSPTSHFDDFYYLGFTDRPKIAYAPSFGTSLYPDSMVPLVRPYLDKFSRLSVREARGAEILKEKFDMDAQVTADPTILLDRGRWDILTQEKSPYERPYALCYFLTYNKAYISFAREYCHERGLDMKVVVTSHDFVRRGFDEVVTGPQGLLNFLKHADMVFTDSFHGTIFSLIFERQFIPFRRFRDDSPLSQNSRMENLLSRTGLADRFMDEASLPMRFVPVEFGRVRQEISRMREESLKYLSDSLNSI